MPITQPPIEMVMNAPLQVSESEDDVIVEIRDNEGTKIQLKEFRGQP